MEGSAAPGGGSVTTGFCAVADGFGFQARTLADGSRLSSGDRCVGSGGRGEDRECCESDGSGPVVEADLGEDGTLIERDVLRSVHDPCDGGGCVA